jgi:gas vesicle protein
MAHEDTGGKVVWFMAGIAIGATVALLYAPYSGEQTRRKIVKKTQQSRDAVADSGKEMLERGKEMFERGRKIVESTASNLKG